MLRTVLLLSSICGLVRSSGVAVAPSVALGSAVSSIAPVANAPVVTAASSQYFQRTFNRLVVPHVIPVAPVAPPPLAQVPVAPAPVPVAPAPTTVFIAPTQSLPAAVNTPPPQDLQPNVAIAIATAHAAAPVATFLLPPYPFGFPPNLGVIPREQSTNAPDENTTEPTTQRTTEAEATTTPELETTTPIDASSSDNSFVQALPSNEDVNFNLYGPPPLPQPSQPGPQFRPQQPNPQFQPQQPRPHFNPIQPRPQFQPQQPQFPPQQPQFPPFPPQQQPRPQFQPQPQPQLRPQFQPQPPPQLQPEFPPYPPKQQPHPVYQPQPRPQFQSRPNQPWPQQRAKPQKLKTSVEVVRVPLAYITPPPLHKPHTHAHVKVVKHVYSYVPASGTKIILKPVKIRPVRLVKHKTIGVRSQNLRANARDIEITTFNPFSRPNIKPPRV